MNWFLQTTIWYLYLFVIGVIFFPMTKKLFGRFFDWGYPFAKTVGILLLSYAAFTLGTLHILPFSRLSLFILLIVAIGVNAVIFMKDRSIRDFFKLPNKDQLFFVFEEILFFISLLFLAYVRGQEPSVRGLEKFMDFGFMNSILNSHFFPPLDMWLSADPSHPQGYPVNYYYFGHLTGALLIKLTGSATYAGYNLILATIFAQGTTLAFSICANLVHLTKRYFNVAKNSVATQYVIGIIGSFILNLGGNLHTIYLFTKGYTNESPVPFWQIFSGFNPTKYWYPNATRFIPFTIHEFPSYSYVVADLHGHVFDIPFVLLTIAVLFHFFMNYFAMKENPAIKQQVSKSKKPMTWLDLFRSNQQYLISVFFGFMVAVHYMTNAWDLLIYAGLFLIVFYFLFRFSKRFLIHAGVFIGSLIVFVIPFSIHFKSIVSSIGVNCSPAFLTAYHKIGPFLFEKGNCQISPPWMLFVLWGFFWVNFAMMTFIWYRSKRVPTDILAIILFSYSTLLIIFPEFFYFKDIYPQHFRANTMFKLGYQAFMMMSIASIYTFWRLGFLATTYRIIGRLIFGFLFIFIFLYPFFSFPSYYGDLKRTPELDGSRWLSANYPGEKAVIDYINANIHDRSVILEAQGDSYTDYDVESSYTGHPTVAGWWVHEWLWRGSADVVGQRIPDIEALYQSDDIGLTKSLIQKYHVTYILVSDMERQKYPRLNEKKIQSITKVLFQSPDKKTTLYKVL